MPPRYNARKTHCTPGETLADIFSYAAKPIIFTYAALDGLKVKQEYPARVAEPAVEGSLPTNSTSRAAKILPS